VINTAIIQLQSESQFLANAPPPCGSNAMISVEQGSFLFIDGQSTVRGIFDGSYAAIAGAPAISIGQTGVSGAANAGGRAQIRRVTVNNSLADGIRATMQSQLSLDEVFGSNNAGYGVKVQNVGSVLVQTTTPGAALGNSNCSLTGRNGVVLSSAITDNPLSAVAVTVNVASTAGFPAAGRIKIDNELISYTGVTVGPDSFTGCNRGSNNTIAASHLLGALASLASGADTIIGATPKQYGAIDGTPAFSELFAGMPTGNSIAIRQA
jgi:hypothetical protein